MDGTITRDNEVRLLRDNVVIHTGKIGSLEALQGRRQRGQAAGFECGIALENFNDIKPGDVIEAFATERVAPEVFA